MDVEVAENIVDAGQELELATFYIGDMLMGIDIRQIQEINQHLHMTPVPHAPDFVRGVVNLRGRVVTVADLSVVLGLGQAVITPRSRNVIVNSNDEQIGLLTDRIADVVTVTKHDIELPPANISGVEGRFFKGVCKLESTLLLIIDVEEVLSCDVVCTAGSSAG